MVSKQQIEGIITAERLKMKDLIVSTHKSHALFTRLIVLRPQPSVFISISCTNFAKYKFIVLRKTK
jgi:hypothetical protein